MTRRKLLLRDILKVLRRGSCVAARSGKVPSCPICSFFNLWIRRRQKHLSLFKEIPGSISNKFLNFDLIFLHRPTYVIYVQFCVAPRILDILILKNKTLFCTFEAGDIVCWLVNPPIAKLDLFKSADCRWICKTCAEYCYRNSATVRRPVQSLTMEVWSNFAIDNFCGCPRDLRGKGIRVSPAW